MIVQKSYYLSYSMNKKTIPKKSESGGGVLFKSPRWYHIGSFIMGQAKTVLFNFVASERNLRCFDDDFERIEIIRTRSKICGITVIPGTRRKHWFLIFFFTFFAQW